MCIVIKVDSLSEGKPIVIKVTFSCQTNILGEISSCSWLRSWIILSRHITDQQPVECATNMHPSNSLSFRGGARCLKHFPCSAWMTGWVNTIRFIKLLPTWSKLNAFTYVIIHRRYTVTDKYSLISLSHCIVLEYISFSFNFAFDAQCFLFRLSCWSGTERLICWN